MGSDEEEVIQSEADYNQFEALLAQKDRLYSINIRIPSQTKPLVVFYRFLTEEEMKDIPPLPEDILDRDPQEKMRALNEMVEEKVWKMIEKAMDENKIEKEYQMTRAQWDSLRESFPDAYNEIVGRISGRTQRIAETFIGGQPTPE